MAEKHYIIPLSDEDIAVLMHLPVSGLARTLLDRVVDTTIVQRAAQSTHSVSTVNSISRYLSSFPPTARVHISGRPVHFTVDSDGSIELHK